MLDLSIKFAHKEFEDTINGVLDSLEEHINISDSQQAIAQVVFKANKEQILSQGARSGQAYETKVPLGRPINIRTGRMLAAVSGESGESSVTLTDSNDLTLDFGPEYLGYVQDYNPVIALQQYDLDEITDILIGNIIKNGIS